MRTPASSCFRSFSDLPAPRDGHGPVRHHGSSQKRNRGVLGAQQIVSTELRREFGLDVARAVLGHSSPVVTEVYAELDGAEAEEAMEKVG